MSSNAYQSCIPSTDCVATESGLDVCECAELAAPLAPVAARLRDTTTPLASNGSSNGRPRTERHAIARTRTPTRRKPLLSGTFWYGLALTHTGVELRTLNPQVLGSSPRGGYESSQRPWSERFDERRIIASTPPGSKLLTDLLTDSPTPHGWLAPPRTSVALTPYEATQRWLSAPGLTAGRPSAPSPSASLG